MARKPSMIQGGIFERIVLALDDTPKGLAEKLGVDVKDLTPLMKTDAKTVSDLETDDVWWALAGHVSKRIGMLLAIKYEMNKLLQGQRAVRAERKRRLERIHGRRI